MLKVFSLIFLVVLIFPTGADAAVKKKTVARRIVAPSVAAYQNSMRREPAKAVWIGRVIGIDPENKTVVIMKGKVINYRARLPQFNVKFSEGTQLLKKDTTDDEDADPDIAQFDEIDIGDLLEVMGVLNRDQHTISASKTKIVE